MLVNTQRSKGAYIRMQRSVFWVLGLNIFSFVSSPGGATENAGVEVSALFLQGWKTLERELKGKL